jgi:hypothetical protein
VKFDPARWSERSQQVILVAVVGVAAVAGLVLTDSPITRLSVTLAPGIIGALVWRFDAIGLLDIASWTLPLTALIAGAWALPPPILPTILAGCAGLWMVSFMFWFTPTRWWYRHVLRKSMPEGGD